MGKKLTKYVVVQDKELKRYIDTNHKWADDLGAARKFLTRAEAKRYMYSRDIEGYDIFIDITKEDYK